MIMRHRRLLLVLVVPIRVTTFVMPLLVRIVPGPLMALVPRTFLMTMLLKQALRALLGQVPVLILHILPGMALTSTEGEGKSGDGQAEEFHDAP